MQNRAAKPDLELPDNLAAERFVLGSFLLQGRDAVDRCGAALTLDCFALDKHRRIWRRIADVHRRGDPVDRVTVANELIRFGELESVDGVSYLISLDDGMPAISNLDAYISILIEKCALRRIAAVAQNTLNRALLAEEEASQIVSSAKSAFDGIETRRESASWMTFDSTLAAHGGTFDEFISPGKSGSVKGIQTPWPSMNKCLGAIGSGDLFLVAARPSMGKSLAALQMAVQAARDGNGVAYFSLEMTSVALERRMLSQISGVDAYKMRSGFLNDQERQAVRLARAERQALPIFINAKGCRTAPAIISGLRELMSQQKISAVVVDHFHLIRGATGNEEERIRFSRIADEFQMAGRELDIPFIVLCQLSRKCEEENRAPGLSDLKETGKLEENADGILFIHRPEVYAKNRGREDLRGLAEFILAKQRDGQTTKVDMVFFGGQQRFVESARGEGL